MRLRLLALAAAVLLGPAPAPLAPVGSLWGWVRLALDSVSQLLCFGALSSVQFFVANGMEVSQGSQLPSLSTRDLPHEAICPRMSLGHQEEVLSIPARCQPEVCGALNVTVSPGPVVDYLEGENATLLCHVSQKRRKDSLLAVRWFFAPDGSQEALMVKMTKLRIIQYYGNFSRTANQQRLRLLEERRGVLYRLSVLTLRPTDQGQYVCKVQEISKHRNKWTAWSNGSSATEMRVISLKAGEDSSFEKKKVTWAFFEDLYVYAVLVCCVGILSVLLFTLVIAWQSVFHKRKSRVRHYLVKCPQNSSGETVTSVTSLAPLQPQKGKRQKKKVDVPPAVPAKAPIATTFHKPKLLKPQRKVALPKITEENLTYAELELIKPHRAAKGVPTTTVYAQILFEENQL